jgi:hypothetical protein
MAEAIACKLNRMGFPDLQPKEQVPYRKIGCTEETDESEESDEIKEIKETGETQEIEEIDEVFAHVWDQISKAILMSAVGSDGNTNHPLFDLAREVRGGEERLRRTFSPKILKKIIEQWQSANLTNLKPDKDYLIEFLDKLSLVRFPAGMVLVKAFKRANNQPPPSRLKGFPRGFQLLGCLCRELQRQAGTEPFFADGRSVAKVLDIPHETIASWIRALCRLRVVYLVKRGVTGRASRYRYIAPD